jgi:hypothetical protein
MLVFVEKTFQGVAHPGYAPFLDTHYKQQEGGGYGKLQRDFGAVFFLHFTAVRIMGKRKAFK